MPNKQQEPSQVIRGRPVPTRYFDQMRLVRRKRCRSVIRLRHGGHRSNLRLPARWQGPAAEGFWGGKQTAGANQGARAPAEKADMTFKWPQPDHVTIRAGRTFF